MRTIQDMDLPLYSTLNRRSSLGDNLGTSFIDDTYTRPPLDESGLPYSRFIWEAVDKLLWIR